MRGRTLWVAGLAGAASVFVHGLGLLVAPAAPVSMPGGGLAQIAMIGDNFRDAATGMAHRAPDRAQTIPMGPVADRIRAAAPLPLARAAVQSATPQSPTAPEQVARARSAPVVPEAIPVLPATPVTAPRPETVVAAAPSPEMMVASAPVPDRVTGRTAPVGQTPGADTPRPIPRAERPPIPAPAAPEPARTPPPAAMSSPGNADANARAGQSAGEARGRSAQSREAGTGQNARPGQGAAQYPFLINRHLSQLRRPTTGFEGTAMIVFTVGDTGALSAISVRHSSGNAEFDRLALNLVRNVTPFPAPPPGAQRTFNVLIGRR